ncbi:MAG: hypothetical protein J0H85_09820 [Sediminibacterium magnilacihabitans]|jgi:hypothetical protein|nr:hypothetical protein [Sediminibacterium magnilacihabitans]PQV60130.1 hypothetical protein CLV53_11060 [Sediminibacterium magnilacihabitans]
MQPGIQLKAKKKSSLEKFGVYYLDRFDKKDLTHHVFDIPDEVLEQKIRKISIKGIVLSAITGLVLVWPTVYIDLLKQNEPWYIHYTWTGGVTLVSIVIELYLLFLIALKAVHEVSELINLHAHKKDFLKSGPFSITNILARTALELPDPEMEVLGIDPFERISKKNLLVLGLLYKLKITITNFAAKFLLLKTVGKTIAGVSINYVALPVECFWNGVVLNRVVKEARLRLFGFALSNHIADNVLHDHLIERLSPLAKQGCLCAIGNAVVMAQNFHPNMVILLLRFQHLLHTDNNSAVKYDDWNVFIDILKRVSKEERNLLLDLFTVAVAFDGKISQVEAKNIKDAYGADYELYRPRLLQLTAHMRAGRLNAAAQLCGIDLVAG